MTLIHFVDCETTGLEDTDEILECCIATWNDGAFNVVFHEEFRPLGSVTPEAAAVNGYTPDRAACFSPLDAAACGRIAAALQGLELWAGSNPGFDKRFLQNAFRRARVAWPKIGHRNVDIASMAVPLLVSGRIQKTGLANLIHFFGLGAQKHRALQDVIDSVNVFQKLLEASCVGTFNLPKQPSEQ